MPKSPLEYLHHILDECRFIQAQRRNVTSFEQFVQDELCKRATVRSLEIIGEASKQIGMEFREQWP
jgi:uncharacterized protein with HEPN domain